MVKSVSDGGPQGKKLDSRGERTFVFLTHNYTYFEALLPLIGTYNFLATNFKSLDKITGSSALNAQNVC